jgi:hypothetical protein
MNTRRKRIATLGDDPHTSARAVAGVSPARATALDVDRATGRPVRSFDAVALTTVLDAVRPGLTGRLITQVTESRTFDVDPPG